MARNEIELIPIVKRKVSFRYGILIIVSYFRIMQILYNHPEPD